MIKCKLLSSLLWSKKINEIDRDRMIRGPDSVILSEATGIERNKSSCVSGIDSAWNKSLVES